MKILNKKKYNDYIKRVYIDISEPEAESLHFRSHNMLDIVCNDIRLSEGKENVEAFTHFPVCKKLCVISGDGDKDKNEQLHKYGICCTCWTNLSRRS